MRERQGVLGHGVMIAGIAVTATTAAAAAAATFWLIQKLRRERTKEPSYEHEICLLPSEQFFAMTDEKPTSFLTWFRGNHEEQFDKIHDRMKQIVAMNPWMSGKVLKKQGACVLAYNPTNASLHVRHLRAGGFSHDMPTERLLDEAGAYFAMPNGGPLWQLTVMPSATDPEHYYGVVFSISHIIADGHTSYKIHRMLLDDRVPIYSLTVERVYETEDIQNEVMGPALSPWVLVLVSVAGLFQMFLTRRKLQRRCFLLDQDVVAKWKQEYQRDSGVPFLSTNDILTHIFFSRIHPSLGLLIFNCRSRIRKHVDSMAGNYAGCLYFTPRSYQHPDGIRTAILQQRRSPVDGYPSTLALLSASRPAIAVVTSMSQGGDFPNQHSHLRLLDPSRPLPTSMRFATVTDYGERRTLWQVWASEEELNKISHFVNGHDTKLGATLSG